MCWLARLVVFLSCFLVVATSPLAAEAPTKYTKEQRKIDVIGKRLLDGAGIAGDQVLFIAYNDALRKKELLPFLQRHYGAAQASEIWDSLLENAKLLDPATWKRVGRKLDLRVHPQAQANFRTVVVGLKALELGEDTLAFIVGHEVGHLLVPDPTDYGLGNGQAIIERLASGLGIDASELHSLWEEIDRLSIGHPHWRQEFRADLCGLLLAQKAGYQAMGGIESFLNSTDQTLNEDHPSDSTRLVILQKTETMVTEPVVKENAVGRVLTRAQVVGIVFSQLFEPEVGTLQQNYGGLYPDVAPEHPQRGPIQWLKGLGLVEMFQDGSFRPDEPMPRYELSYVLTRCSIVLSKRVENWTRIWKPTPQPSRPKDVPDRILVNGYPIQQPWNDVGKAVQLGFLELTSDGRLNGDGPVTEPDLAKAVDAVRRFVARTRSGYINQQGGSVLVSVPAGAFFTGTNPGTDGRSLKGPKRGLRGSSRGMTFFE